LNSRPSPLVLAMVEDITDKKSLELERERAEQSLRESEERFRLAQSAARMGTFEWNIRTGVNTWTPELEAMYGLPPGGFGGTQAAFENLVHPDDRARVIQLVDGAMKTGKPTRGEWRVVWPDGSAHWIVGRWQVLMDESGSPLRMIGVNLDVTERKLAEETLRESEERFRLAAQAGRMYAYTWDVATDVVVRSGNVSGVLGSTGEALLTRQQLLARVHPDDRALFNASVSEQTPEHPYVQIRYRMLRPDGSVMWVEKTAHAFFDEGGRMVRVIGMVADITERKRAEEALEDMRRKLIEAQEQERARIARDLHDDVSQRLAMLAIGLEEIQQNVPDSASELRSRIDALQKQTVEISADVQAISHELHSPSLEYLGIATSMRRFCKDFGRQRKVDVDFRSEDLTTSLSPEISLCLFRVLQEALHNAVKYSGVKHVEARLMEHSSEVHLTVSDSGRGFDMEAAKQGRGLGLTSMCERVRLVNGTIAIESKPMGGTTIHVRVPLESSHVSKTEAL